MTTERHDPERVDLDADPPARDDAGAEEATTLPSADEAADVDADSSGPSTADLARAGADRDVSDDDDADEGETSHDDDSPAPLFAAGDAGEYRSRWQEVQTQFVDDPRQAVERADTLVAELMQKLAETFASERSELERQWDRGGEVSTEDLRIALQRYRSFFDRLLSL